MPKRWVEPEEIAPPPEMAEVVGGHPLVAETLTRRGILDPQRARAFLDPEHYTPAPAEDLPGVIQAADRILRAIQAQETILVWGDFDVDGQTATTLLVEGLHNLEATVVYHIPVREREGHGIQPAVLQELLSPGSPQPHPYPPRTAHPQAHLPSLLVTCDTGIAAFDAVELAQQLGLEVIITDHHEPSRNTEGQHRLPEAEVVINPHLLPAEHPLSTLPGVGVAYKLLESLYQRMNLSQQMDRFLDLVALGIVADVADQVGDTRYLLQRGLQVLRENQRPGMAALLRAAKISPSNLDESNIGFGIGPRLNALGRLRDANPVVEFFTTRDGERAEYLAQYLDNLNIERRTHTERIYQGALDRIRMEPGLLDYSALVLAQPGWHTGIIGIVASRLVERFGLPTVLLHVGEDGIGRGSARSVEGLHLADALAAQEDLLIRYGGHAGAAGLSLKAENIPELRSRLSRTVKAKMAGQALQPVVNVDAVIPFADIDLDFVNDLERLGPFGAGNPQPVLVSRDLKLVSATRIGRESEHLRLVMEDPDEVVQEILWWRGADEPQPEIDEIVDLAFHASSSTYQGLRQLQLEWVDYRPCEDRLQESRRSHPQRTIIDYRNEVDPLRLLQALQSRGKVQVWAEGEGRNQVGGRSRDRLKPADSLAIWTAPPSYRTLESVLQKVNPETIYVFAIPPELDRLKPYLHRLAGLVKGVSNRLGGVIQLRALAAAMAHTPGTIEVGLRMLQAMGAIGVETVGLSKEKDDLGGDETIKLTLEKRGRAENVEEVGKILSAILAETAAYRAYFRSGNLDAILGSRV